MTIAFVRFEFAAILVYAVKWRLPVSDRSLETAARERARNCGRRSQRRCAENQHQENQENLEGCSHSLGLTLELSGGEAVRLERNVRHFQRSLIHAGFKIATAQVCRRVARM